eukprot:TRINITY_DN6206_c0_g1_i4.p1 TRINITY_DN6206_c0_g1~~TRINITY_DN6206_c0_g1_i4.p1  ORF type:complete len:1342 (+),score=226.75 TRINITY_DN6206_c0_g1_i4:3-4028(+)
MWCCLLSLLVLVLASRPYGGSGNNLAHPLWGLQQQPMLRDVLPYTPYNFSADPQPNPRLISQTLNALRLSRASETITSGLPAWGLFCEHSFLSTKSSSDPPTLIPIPFGDSFFDADRIGNQTLAVGANQFANDSVSGTPTPVNALAPFITSDAVHGSSSARATLLRTFSGGKLRTLPGNPLLPPMDDGSMAPAPTVPGTRFLLADARANIWAPLLAFHVIFLREHNRLCDEFHSANPALTDEELFQKARATIEALIQHITIDEYLPRLLGETLPAYAGYNADLQPGIDLFFATSAFRYGHSAVTPLIYRRTPAGDVYPTGHLLLRDQLWNHQHVLDDGIEPVILGMAFEADLLIDVLINQDLRNFLHFGAPTHATDLMSINILRARQRGLPSYNQCRVALGLAPVASFSEITSDVETQQRLSDLYGGDVNRIEAYVGGLAEQPTGEGILGPLFAASVQRQFERLRTSDRYWYENGVVLSAAEIAAVKSTSLSQVVARNTNLTNLPASFFSLTKTIGSTAGDVTTSELQFTNGCIFKWKLQRSQKTVSFDLSCKSAGWMAIGLGGSGMKRVDMVLVSNLASAAPIIADGWSFTFERPHDDTDIGGTADIKNSRVSVVDGTAQLTWSRKFDTADEYDYTFDPAEGTAQVICAAGSSQDIDYHGPRRSMAIVDFFSGSVTTVGLSEVRSVTIFHGVVMLLTFAVAYPGTIFVARYSHEFPDWLSTHRSLASVSAFSMFLLAMAAIATRRVQFLSHHGKIGLALVCLIICQLSVGYTSTLFSTFFRKSSNHWLTPTRVGILRRFHVFFGYLIVLLGIINVFFGIDRLLPGKPELLYVYAGWLAIVLILLALGPWVIRIFRRFSQITGLATRRESGARLPQFRWEEVRARVEMGQRWIVLDGYVHDVVGFEKQHPGGPSLIDPWIGKDATVMFFGRRRLRSIGSTSELSASEGQSDPLVEKHSHSRYAISLLSTMRIGEILESSAAARHELSSPPLSPTAPGSQIVELTVIRPNLQLARNVPEDWSSCVLVGKVVLTGPKSAAPLILLRLKLPASSESLIFEPSEHILVSSMINGAGVQRTYTPVAVQGQRGFLDLAIKAYPNGKLSKYLTHRVPIGENVLLKVRVTQQTLPLQKMLPSLTYFGLVAAGSGITTVLSFLRNALALNPGCTIRVMYIVSQTDDLAFQRELLKNAVQYATTLRLHFVLTQETPELHPDLQFVEVVGPRQRTTTLSHRGSIASPASSAPEAVNQSVMSAVGSVAGVADYLAPSSLDAPEENVSYSCGRPSPALFQNFLVSPVAELRTVQSAETTPETARILVCGPPALNQATIEVLQTLGVPKEIIVRA